MSSRIQTPCIREAHGRVPRDRKRTERHTKEKQASLEDAPREEKQRRTVLLR